MKNVVIAVSFAAIGYSASALSANIVDGNTIIAVCGIVAGLIWTSREIFRAAMELVKDDEQDYLDIPAIWRMKGE